MKNMETIEGNRIIAEWMGLKQGEDGYRVPWLPKHHWSDSKYGDMYTNHYRHLQFRTSWDWLMPVVEKITSLHDVYSTRFISKYGSKPAQLIDQVRSAVSYVELNKAWTKIIELIQWYNTNLTHPTH